MIIEKKINKRPKVDQTTQKIQDTDDTQTWKILLFFCQDLISFTNSLVLVRGTYILVLLKLSVIFYSRTQ